MKVKQERLDVRGTEEGYKVGLTYHKNRQSYRNTSKYTDKDRGKNIIKTSISSISLDVHF